MLPHSVDHSYACHATVLCGKFTSGFFDIAYPTLYISDPAAFVSHIGKLAPPQIGTYVDIFYPLGTVSYTLRCLP